MSNLLIVDDEQTICWGLTRLGESIGHQVSVASSAEQALAETEKNKPDLIILDVRLPGMDGLTALEKFHDQHADVPVIMITAFGDLKTAVNAVKNGAFEYLIKPFDLDQMEKAIKRALKSGIHPPRKENKTIHVGDLVGNSVQIQQVFKNIALAATSKTPVMLYGESGSGKELAARAIHKFGPRAEAPFVPVNVASLSVSLAESELFGHVEGAFTGAEKTRIGLLEQANGGTLFLDEVADIPMPIQVKLLRVLDHNEILPVGSNKTVNTDFRVISATHQSLENKVRNGTFRHDLYFRLCGFQIDIPPLRERRNDIPELANHFLSLISQEPLVSQLKFDDQAMEELQKRNWYGNVRELKNAVEHAALRARGGLIQPELLPPPITHSMIGELNQDNFDEELITQELAKWAERMLAKEDFPGGLYDDLLSLVEKPVLDVALKQNQNQYAAAARILGLHRTTLKKKLDQYGLSKE